MPDNSGVESRELHAGSSNLDSVLRGRFHSITIGNYNTWNDWHLVPSSRPFIEPPEVKTETLDVPGADGSVDFTGALNGVRFKDRQGSWEFIMLPGYGRWYERYSAIMNAIQGARVRIIFDDDPTYYYYGRVSVTSFEAGDHYSTITISYFVEPYKHLLSNSTSKML